MNRLLLAPLAIALLGCGEGFEPQHELSTLRVLAVQKEPPYTTPDSTVELTMLWDDARHRGPNAQNIDPAQHVHWFGGCVNPPGGAFAACYPQLIPAFLPLLQPVEDRADIPFLYGRGNRFSVGAPSAREALLPPIDPQQPPFGSEFVFFALCAGELELAPAFESLISDVVEQVVEECLDPACVEPVQQACTREDCTPELLLLCAQDTEAQMCALQLLAAEAESDALQGFPLLCREENGGDYLGPDDYVAGYSQLFIYDEITNQNPVITDVEFGGRSDWDCRCIGQECVEDPDADPPIPAFDCPEDADIPSVAACEDDGDPSCPETDFGPVVDGEQSAEEDAALASGIREQVWVNYYVDGGGLSRPLRLLNDAERGWNSDYKTGFLAPKEPGRVNLWAVVHDNRGGLNWVRQTVNVE